MFQDSGDGAIKITVAWIGIIGAVLTALVALFNSIYTQTMTRRNQRDLESFKASLNEQKAEKRCSQGL